jgi:DNA-binding MarR family transcriptional regulator
VSCPAKASRSPSFAGQTQARWQVMWIAATGRFSVATVARRLGLARQSVQRVADAIVADGLATFQPNPDHRRSPLLILTDVGQTVLDTINNSGSEHNLHQAAVLVPDGIAEPRRLLRCYRDALHK